MEVKDSGYINFCVVKSIQHMRRQNAPSYYYPNGAIYLAAAKTWEADDFLSRYRIPYVMDEDVSIDIDSQQDFDQALAVFQQKNASQ
jgi:CMP-N-acetylneuraminic acid synthetase